MHFFIFVLLLSFFIFLFSLFSLANGDLPLLRKDISLEKIFNTAFIDSLISLFFARLVYGVFNATNILINPFIFLLFPYFPGLSLVGGIVGGTLFLIMLAKIRNMPVGRLFDFFAVSFLSAMPVGFLGYFILSKIKLFSPMPLFSLISYVVLLALFIKYFLPSLSKGNFKDGTVGLLFLICFSLISITANIISEFNGFYFFRKPENIALIIIFLSSVSLFIKQEKLFWKIRR